MRNIILISSNCKEGKDEVALKATLPAMIIGVIMILEFITKQNYFSLRFFYSLISQSEKERKSVIYLTAPRNTKFLKNITARPRYF